MQMLRDRVGLELLVAPTDETGEFDLAQFEALAFRDLEGAMLALLRLSIAHLRGRGLEAAPLTLAALAAYERDERSPLSA